MHSHNPDLGLSTPLGAASQVVLTRTSVAGFNAPIDSFHKKTSLLLTGRFDPLERFIKLCS